MTDIFEQLAIIRSNQYGESVKGAVRDALSLVAQDRGGEEIQRYTMGPAIDDTTESVTYDLFDYDLIRGHGTDATGVIAPADENKLAILDYIPVESRGITLEVKAYVTTQTKPLEWYFYCYDANKAYLSTKSRTAVPTSGSSYQPVSWKAGTIISNIPSDVWYVRVGFRRNSSVSSLFVTDVTSATVTISRNKYW